MMLLSTAAIILHDIVSAVPRKKMQSRQSATRQRFTSRAGDEPEILAGRIRRALQQPANLRAIRKEAAAVIAGAALAANAIPSSRITSRTQIPIILHDPEVARFVEQQLFHEGSESRLSRRDTVNAFEEMVSALEKAAKEFA